MTPKKKALELLNRFKFQCEHNCQPSTVKGISKNSSLICVSEIINLDYFSVEGREYWKQVKQEIEKL